jgi:hypothetical protein
MVVRSVRWSFFPERRLCLLRRHGPDFELAWTKEAFERCSFVEHKRVLYGAAISGIDSSTHKHRVVGLAGQSLNALESENSSRALRLSKQLGLSVIAEGIENRATADFLVSMGCEEGQGYFFGRPMPAADFEAKFLNAEAAAELA